MAINVRDIIVESFSRANLVPRKRDLPPDMFVSGLRLLNGILQDYSTKGFIVAYQSEVEFDPAPTVTVGKGDTADVQVDDIVLPKAVYYQNKTSIDWTPLQFISYVQFYSESYSDYVVSWKPAGEGLFQVYFKPRFAAQNRKCKLIYDVEMTLADNDQVTLPTPYVELLTRSLAYRLAVAYPRADQSKVTLLKAELDEMERSLEARNSSNRIITRESWDCRGSLLTKFDSGSFIW